MTKVRTHQEADALRQEAAECEQRRQKSITDSGTDGFVSQWADGLNARVARLQADIIEDGGEATFTGLFNLEGRRVRAKVIDGKFGPCWAFCDENDKFTGQFISAFPKRASTMIRKGFEEKDELAPARAKICGGKGRGLRGAASCYVAAVRTDDGYPKDAITEAEIKLEKEADDI